MKTIITTVALGQLLHLSTWYTVYLILIITGRAHRLIQTYIFMYLFITLTISNQERGRNFGYTNSILYTRKILVIEVSIKFIHFISFFLFSPLLYEKSKLCFIVICYRYIGRYVLYINGWRFWHLCLSRKPTILILMAIKILPNSVKIYQKNLRFSVNWFLPKTKELVA